MDVVVISLNVATARRAAAARELRQVGLPFEIFDAVPAKHAYASLSHAVDPRAFRLNAQRDPVPGELGCYASHRAVWRLAVERREPLIVLEDDFSVLPTLPTALPMLTPLMRECDFVRLEPIHRRRACLKKFRPIAYRLRSIGSFELLYLSDVPLRLTGYAISPRGAARLLRASRRIVAPVDKFVQRTWAHGVPVHALYPPIVQPSPLAAESTIGSRKQLKSRDPRLLLARALYKGFGELKRLRFDRAQLGRAMPAKIRRLDSLVRMQR